MRLSSLSMVAAYGLMIAISGCESAPGRPRLESVTLRPESELRFDVLYRNHCAGCHGADGKDGAAIDLANPVYQEWVDDRSLRSSISDGVPGSQMPAFAIAAGGSLTEAQVEVLIRGIRQRWASAANLDLTSTPSHSQPANADSTHGRYVFCDRCSRCHKGSEPGITNSNYLALATDQELRTIVVAGRPDIGHPDWQHYPQANVLSDRDITDVVGFLGLLRRGPATYQSCVVPRR